MAEETKNGPGESAASEPTESEVEETQASEATDTEEPTERARTRHSAQSRAGLAARALTAVALVVALAALGVSLWVLLKKPWTESSSAETTSTAPPGPSPQQVADAKAKACAAYVTVSNAVSGRANAPIGSEPEAVAANARLAAAAGQPFLLERLDPATPAPLADAIRKYAANIQNVAMFSLAGVGSDEPAQGARINEWPALNTQITDLCK